MDDNYNIGSLTGTIKVSQEVLQSPDVSIIQKRNCLCRGDRIYIRGKADDLIYDY